MSKSRVIENRLSSIRPTEMSLTGRPRIGSPAARSAVANSCDIVVAGHILRLEMDFGDAAVIAGDQAVEDFGQPHPRAAVDAAHDAEVDRRDAAVGKREQIAVVKVGVEEAVDHRLAQEGADRIAASALQSWPAAISASRSLSLIPSSHSSVSTRRAVRRQSISGT